MMRFTIRDLLWLTLTVAIGAGWWASVADMRQRAMAEHRRMVAIYDRDMQSKDELIEMFMAAKIVMGNR